ncbi:MAG: adenylate kinase, partial [Clostridiales bacterium]|nr:adenylate kinase [Clostridiales bacterium]
VCDICGGELITRKDDEPETVRNRLAVYHRETEPLVDFYRERGKLRVVENQPTIEATTVEVFKVLGIEK